MSVYTPLSGTARATIRIGAFSAPQFKAERLDRVRVLAPLKSKIGDDHYIYIYEHKHEQEVGEAGAWLQHGQNVAEALSCEAIGRGSDERTTRSH